MAKLISLLIDVTKVTKSRLYEGKNGAKYLKLTISVNDEPDQFGNTVGCYEEQTKDEREAKAKRNYLGNGKVTWSNDQAATPAPPAPALATPAQNQDDDNLPF